MGQWFESIRKRPKKINMYFILNFFIWVRKNAVRIIFKQYPNRRLTSSCIHNTSEQKINLITSTDNPWVSKYMFDKWTKYSERKKVNLSIFSNQDVNNYMCENFRNKLIYEIYKRSVIPVQKIDIFRICFIFKSGGIWLDLKSEVNLSKVINLYKQSNKKGLLLQEPRKIEIIKDSNGNNKKSLCKVIHNGFFYLPKGSAFLNHLINKIERDFIYFQDVEFTYPKQGIMNLTGPHQFTRTFQQLTKNDRPFLVSHEDVDWIYCSKYGEYVSPFSQKKHYSALKTLKTLDSNKEIFLS